MKAIALRAQPVVSALRLVKATPADLDRIMELEHQGFAACHQEASSTYAQRIEAFAQGSFMAWREEECVGCVFSEIWRFTPEPGAAHFTLGHDIRERHDPLQGTELYISSMTLTPAVRGQGLGPQLLDACITNVAQAFPQLTSVVLLVNANWTAARQIYIRAGFLPIAHLEGFFGATDHAPEDGIVMRRPWLVSANLPSGTSD